MGPRLSPGRGQGLLLHSDWEGRVGPVWLSQPFSYPQGPISHPRPHPTSPPHAPEPPRGGPGRSCCLVGTGAGLGGLHGLVSSPKGCDLGEAWLPEAGVGVDMGAPFSLSGPFISPEELAPPWALPRPPGIPRLSWASCFPQVPAPFPTRAGADEGSRRVSAGKLRGPHWGRSSLPGALPGASRWAFS